MYGVYTRRAGQMWSQQQCITVMRGGGGMEEAQKNNVRMANVIGERMLLLFI